MGIMDKIHEGLNKGKDLVNKTTGGQHSAQSTAPPQDVSAQATDAGAPTTAPTETPSATADSETTVEPTSEA
jgi:hypothetical protein